MKIVTNEAEKVELISLEPGDVFSCCNSEYWIVSDATVGTSIVTILRLDDGFLANLGGDTKVTPLPDAYLKVQ